MLNLHLVQTFLWYFYNACGLHIKEFYITEVSCFADSCFCCLLRYILRVLKIYRMFFKQGKMFAPSEYVSCCF